MCIISNVTGIVNLMERNDPFANRNNQHQSLIKFVIKKQSNLNHHEVIILNIIIFGTKGL